MYVSIYLSIYIYIYKSTYTYMYILHAYYAEILYTYILTYQTASKHVRQKQFSIVSANSIHHMKDQTFYSCVKAMNLHIESAWSFQMSPFHRNLETHVLQACWKLKKILNRNLETQRPFKTKQSRFRKIRPPHCPWFWKGQPSNGAFLKRRKFLDLG